MFWCLLKRDRQNTQNASGPKIFPLTFRFCTFTCEMCWEGLSVPRFTVSSLYPSILFSSILSSHCLWFTVNDLYILQQGEGILKLQWAGKQVYAFILKNISTQSWSVIVVRDTSADGRRSPHTSFQSICTVPLFLLFWKYCVGCFPLNVDHPVLSGVSSSN